eukprot:7390261-Prymnesium_polylepis.3
MRVRPRVGHARVAHAFGRLDDEQEDEGRELGEVERGHNDADALLGRDEVVHVAAEEGHHGAGDRVDHQQVVAVL